MKNIISFALLSSICCSVDALNIAPSSFRFSNSSSSATKSAEKRPTLTQYEIDSVTTDGSDFVKKTICPSSGSCYITSELDTSTTATLLVNGILTVTVPGVNSTDSTTNSLQTSYIEDDTTVDSTFQVTKTVCDSSECHATTELDSSTTLTTTVNGILTTIVTDVPVSNSTSESISKPTPLSVKSSSSSSRFSSKVTNVPLTLTTILSTPTKDVNGGPSSQRGSFIFSTTDEGTSTTDEGASTTDEGTSTTDEGTSTTDEGTSTTDEGTSTTDVSSIVVTDTSCSKNRCSKIPKTTGLTTITENNTAYTTYCPYSEVSSSGKGPKSSSGKETIETKFSSEYAVSSRSTGVDFSSVKELLGTQVTSSSSKAANGSPISNSSAQTSTIKVESLFTDTHFTTSTSESTSTPTTLSNSVLSTVNVITDNIVTESAAPTLEAQSSSYSATSTSISTYEGSGSIVTATGLFGLITYVILLI